MSSCIPAVSNDLLQIVADHQTVKDLTCCCLQVMSSINAGVALGSNMAACLVFSWHVRHFCLSKIWLFWYIYVVFDNTA